MITADDVKKIREQSATPKLQKGKVTADMVANIRQNMAQQPTPQQTYNEAVAQAGQKHGQLAQQGQRNLAQKQAVIYSPEQQQRNNVQDFKTVLENYSKENNRLPTDPKELKALAEANGLYSGENKYQIDKLQATQSKNPVLNNEIRTSQLGSGTIKKDEAFDKSYGKREGQEEFKSLDFTSNNNSDKYEEYKQNLEIAKENKDTRNIAKYSSLLEEYKKKYKELYGNTKLETKQLPGLKRTIEQEQNDLNELSKQYLNATTPQEKNNIAVQFNRVDENLKNHTKVYQDTIAWDEIVNKNIAVDSMKSLGKNVTGGTANILNAGYTLGTKLIGDDATTINANALLNYTRPRNAVSNTIQNIASVAGSAMNPLSTITGINESPDMAYLHLTRLRATHPENQRLAKLYNDITNKTYSGTAEDLKNELDAIQKELYQYAKDNILRTQDELDAVADQVRHNESYGSLSMIPNAFGTVGNMIPSMIAGAGIGEVGSMAMLGLNAGGSSMDQALQSGARYNQALNYGILSGGTEVATEKMFDTGANKLLGIKGGLDTKGLANRVIDGLGIKSKVGKVIANTAFDVGGEMVEEMVAEAVNPLWKALSYEGLEALPQNGEELGQYIKDIINAGVEAIPSTLLMQGGGAVLNTYKTQQLENGLIKSINESDLSQIVKNQLINEVRKASTDVKLGLEESDYIQDKAYEKGFNLAAQSEQMKQRIPQGYTLPQSTIDILSYTENNRPGLNIAFDTNIQGNGTFVENPDGTRTITLNPNSQRAVEFTLTHELGHDLKGTQEYTQLQNLLEDYAKGKPKYQESLDALNKTYQNSNANYNLKDEATNDMLGQAIGEQEFYNKLAENPTLFNRVTQGLKNLLGNKESKLKNKIEKLTRNAYQSAYKGTGSNQVQNSLSELRDTEPLIKTINDIALNKIVEKAGTDAYSLKGNIGKNIEDAKRYLINNTNLVKNYALEKGIPVTGEKRAINFSRLWKPEIQDFVRNNNLDVKKLANNPEMVEQFLDIQVGKGEYDGKKAWRNLYDYVRNTGEIPSPLKAVEREMSYIRNGITEEERNELSHQQKEEISNTKEFQEYLDNYLNNLFDENQYTTDEVMEEAKENHGTTDDYGTGAYMTTDGELLDFNDHGYRDDHRTLSVFDMDMQDFMDYGAIRMQPESDGFEIAVEPTQEQYDRLEDYIDTFVKNSNNSETINIDIDTAKGNNDIAKSYSKDTPTTRIINDIKTYFRTGKYPNSRFILYSKQNGQWQQFLDKNFNWRPNGTRTNFTKTDTTMLPSNEELQQQERNRISKDAQALNLQEPEVRLTESDDETLFSLSEQEQKEVEGYIQEVANDNAIPENVKNDLLERFNSINSYEQFNELKKAVKDYKDLTYGTLAQRQQKVADYIKDRKTAENTKGQEIKGKDIKQAISKNIGSEKGNSKTIKNVIKSMNEDMKSGNLTDNQIEKYVEQLGDSLKAYITDYYDMYKDLKKTLKNTKIYVTPEIKRGITDYNDFRKANMGNLTLTSDSSNRTIDQVWKELQEQYPEMLPDDISNPIDQLEYIADMVQNIRPEESNVRNMLEKQYGDEAWVETANNLKNDLKDLRDNQRYEAEEIEKEPKEKNLKWIKTAQSNDLIREFIEQKDKAYMPSSNKQQLAHANKQLATLGYEGAKAYLDNKTNLNQRITATDMALGERLIQEAIKQGKFDEAQELIADTAILSKDYGQVIQATSMIARMTPEGQLMYLNKVINRLNDRIDTKNEKRAKDKQLENIKLESEYGENILKAQDNVELEQAIDAALQRIADQMPVTFGDKVAEWRYLSMLANPRTHFRNFIANIGMKLTYSAKNQVQRAIETLASPLLEERYRTFEKSTDDVKAFAEQSTKEQESVLAQQDNKTVEGRLKELQKVFKNETLEKLRRFNSYWLSKEDNIFTQAAYKANLTEYLTANGIKTQHDIDMNPEIVQKGIEFARNEAWKTTFHQFSKFATELNRIENINGFSRLVVGGTVPFKKTPVNIAKTGAAYSPLGLIETVTAETYKLQKGDITANEYIDRISQGLTGTALFTLGTLLAKFGILKGGTDDDDKYAEDIGQTKKYSIRVGNKNYDISWAAPSAMPLLMGAELVDATKGKEISFGDLAETMASTINPLSEMSFLSGFNNTIKSYSNSDNSVDALGAAIKNSLKSYFGQFVPTIGGQINKIIDDTERNTTATKASKWKEGETFLRQQLNKIPGGSFLLEPKTDVWGNEKKRSSNPITRAFDALINPGTVTEDKTTDVDREIMALIDATDDSSLAPSVPKNNFKYNSEEVDLSSKDYTKFKKTYGQFMYENYDALLDNEYYKSLEPNEKAKVISNIEKTAKDVAKNEVGYETDSHFKFDVIKDELEEAGIPLIDYFLIGRDITSSTSKNKKQTIIARTVEMMNQVNEKISKEQKDALRDIFGVN